MGTGVASRRLANTKAEKALSLFPIFFAIQQLLEGTLWMVLLGRWPQALKTFSITGFLTFAVFVWPVVVPLTAYLFEVNKLRKKILLAFLVGGVLFSMTTIFLYFQGSVGAEIQGQHINYFTSFVPISGITFNVIELFYLILVVLPFLVSSNRKLNIGGFVVFIAYMIAQYFYAEVFISTWCFFAAVLSVAVYLFLRSSSFQADKSDKKLKSA